MRRALTPDASARLAYGRVAAALHWAIAALIFSNLLIAWYWVVCGGPHGPLARIHISIGWCVIVLTLMRIGWRSTHRPPPLSAGLSSLERIAAHGAHALLYGFMLVMPLSGWLLVSSNRLSLIKPLYWFGLIELPPYLPIAHLSPTEKDGLHDLFVDVHFWLSWGLVALLVLHVAGALKHQFLDREPSLERMWPWRASV